MNARPAVALVLALAALAAGLGIGASGSGAPAVTFLPDNPSKPYTITAIDYHFHDAHPTIPLSPDRTVRWTNQGTLVHNVTIPAIGFSKDIPVGGAIEIDRLGQELGGSGTYTFFCRYHANLGMSGTIVVS